MIGFRYACLPPYDPSGGSVAYCSSYQPPLNHVEYCSDYRVEFVDFVRTVNPTPQAPVREECYVRRD